MKSLSDVLPQLIDLNDKIMGLREIMVSKYGINYEGQDARTVAMASIQVDLISFGMWINAYYYIGNNKTDKDGRFHEKEFLDVFGGSFCLADTERFLFNQQSNALLTSVNFRLDNLFRNILNVLNPDLSDSSYYKKSKEVINKTLVNDKEISHGVLIAFANVRNSLHNNGIFKGKSDTFLINGVKYDFIHGQEIPFANLQFYITCIDEVIDVLYKILLSENVIWPSFIEDEFASKFI